ncbi:putative ATP-dependent RNA helicase DHR1 [Balamuthia mandrillaris]
MKHCLEQVKDLEPLVPKLVANDEKQLVLLLSPAGGHFASQLSHCTNCNSTMLAMVDDFCQLVNIPSGHASIQLLLTSNIILIHSSSVLFPLELLNYTSSYVYVSSSPLYLLYLSARMHDIPVEHAAVRFQERVSCVQHHGHLVYNHYIRHHVFLHQEGIAQGNPLLSSSKAAYPIEDFAQDSELNEVDIEDEHGDEEDDYGDEDEEDEEEGADSEGNNEEEQNHCDQVTLRTEQLNQPGLPPGNSWSTVRA